jgi:hypothetical protein
MPGVTRGKPPGLRKTTSRTKNCHTCRSMNRRTGGCMRYLNPAGRPWPVERDDMCNVWAPRQGA